MAEIVHLLRHAPPPPDRVGRYWGHSDPGVDEAGLDRAATLASLVRTRPERVPERVLASPLTRAVRTAEAIAPAWGLPVAIDPDLAEIDFGDFDGLTFDEISRRFPEGARQWAAQLDAFAFPGGESIDAFHQRATRVWRRVVDASAASVLVVAHGGVLAVWCCLFLGLPLSRRFTFRPECAALTAFVRRDDAAGWEMACFNDKA